MQSTLLPDPIWVDQTFLLRQMLDHLLDASIVAVDTESNSLFAYTEQVCLIQFSIPEYDYLVDPLSLPDLSTLEAIFSDPDIEKIFHAAEYDLICLKRDYGFQFANLFDTMLAARILGKPAVGLGALLESEFGITHNKHYQRADWGRRPLFPDMLAYAQLDTHYLVPLRDRLKDELETSGRWPLAEEDFRRSCQLGQYVNGNGQGEPSCWKVSGSQDLTPQQAAVLQELCGYRNDLAQRADLPPFKIMGDRQILELAQSCPGNPRELKEATHLSERQFHRYGDGLLKTIQRGLRSAPIRRPPSPRRDVPLIERLDVLKNWRKQAAQRMHVESDVVLPRDALMRIAEADPRSQDELASLMADLPWRYDHFGREILNTLGHME